MKNLFYFPEDCNEDKAIRLYAGKYLTIKNELNLRH